MVIWLFGNQVLGAHREGVRTRRLGDRRDDESAVLVDTVDHQHSRTAGSNSDAVSNLHISPLEFVENGIERRAAGRAWSSTEVRGAVPGVLTPVDAPRFHLGKR